MLRCMLAVQTILFVFYSGRIGRIVYSYSVE